MCSLNTGTIYLGIIDRVFKDSEIGEIAKRYSVPDFKAYIATVAPISIPPYLQDGGSHVILGMEYINYNYGFQISFGRTIKHRTIYEGVWEDWKTVTMS